MKVATLPRQDELNGSLATGQDIRPLAERVPQEWSREFNRRVVAREVKVGILGLGYVGLPLALGFAEQGFAVTGFDKDERKVRAMHEGQSTFSHIADERVKACEQFDPTTDAEALKDCDALLVCVPTPIGSHREPDLTAVERAVDMIRSVLRPGQLVVLESTVAPGTTRDLVLPRLEASGLRNGQDFFIAYSPEREDPGNQNFSNTTIPKLVGGLCESATQAATALYEKVVAKVVPVASCEIAEAAKLTENVFRAVNLGLVNELKMVFDGLDIPVHEVLDAAATKPFGFMRFNPGPGWGGHCIPVDPYYLSWTARRIGQVTRFVDLAGEVNQQMPHFVVSRIQQALNDRRKAVKGSRILLVGLAYKKDVEDCRESPSWPIWHLLEENGAEVAYHDPFVPSTRVGARIVASQELDRACEYDAVVVLTDHSTVDWGELKRKSQVVVDTRGVYSGVAGAPWADVEGAEIVLA